MRWDVYSKAQACFVEYLLELSNLPIKQIKEQLELRLKVWQGTQSQRDDISLIGIRI